LLRQVIAGLGELPDDASFTQIKAALDRAAFQSVPESVRRRALDIFGDEASAAEWLTTRIVVLGGQTPVDTLMRVEGEEEVLGIFGRIEHGICS
jgi:putative toxin-antitoxin system antitoxin component (TIGR02293 family)